MYDVFAGIYFGIPKNNTYLCRPENYMYDAVNSGRVF